MGYGITGLRVEVWGVGAYVGERKMGHWALFPFLQEPGMGVFDDIGNSARLREVTQDNHISDLLMGLGKKPEDRDFYDRAMVQQAPMGSALRQLGRLLTGK